MINAKETLKKLHKEFPTLTLDDLFRILDCYVESNSLSNEYLQPKIWCNTSRTTGVNEQINNDNSTIGNITNVYGNTSTTTKPVDCQFTASHSIC